MSAPAPAPLVDRPAPLTAAAKPVSIVLGLLGTVLTALVTFSVLTADQGTALSGVLAVVPVLVSAVSPVLAAFGVARRAKDKVTPVADPATLVYDPAIDDYRLVSLVPAESTP